jgi:hypothetical protein
MLQVALPEGDAMAKVTIVGAGQSGHQLGIGLVATSP